MCCSTSHVIVPILLYVKKKKKEANHKYTSKILVLKIWYWISFFQELGKNCKNTRMSLYQGEEKTCLRFLQNRTLLWKFPQPDIHMGRENLVSKPSFELGLGRDSVCFWRLHMRLGCSPALAGVDFFPLSSYICLTHFLESQSDFLQS